MVDFPCHALRKNHATGLPHRVIYLDTETTAESYGVYQRHIMKLAWTCAVRYGKDGAVERETWEEWRGGLALCKYLEKACAPETAVYLFGHNVFFDLQASGFFHWFAAWGWICQFYYEKGVTYILIAAKEGRCLKAVSSTNYYECSLKELGSMVGLEKGEVEFASVDSAALSAYCHKDVEILRLGMERYFAFLRTNDLGRFRLSKASQAMAAYRHRFMNTPIFLHHHEEVRKLERESYFGGRVDCFRIGKVEGGPFLSLDVNSMYPFIMATKPVPVRLVDYRTHLELEEIEDVLSTFGCIARVRLNCDLPIYPIRKERRVLYPVGRFSAVLGTAALKDALERGYVEEIQETALYETAVVFSGYVAFFHTLKELYTRENRPADRYLVKKLLNALYGKWAQKRPIVEENVELSYEGYYREEILDLVTGHTEIEWKLLNKWVRLFGEEDTEQTFTAISAAITEQARMYLWSMIEPLYPDRILYCDTDSLKIRESDLAYLTAEVSDGKLGALKVEEKFNSLHIYGPKAYVTERSRVIKGIPKRAEQVGPVSYRYTGFFQQATHQRARLDSGSLTKEVVKTLWLKYDKGTVTADGRVIPFRF